VCFPLSCDVCRATLPTCSLLWTWSRPLPMPRPWVERLESPLAGVAACPRFGHVRVAASAHGSPMCATGLCRLQPWSCLSRLTDMDGRRGRLRIQSKADPVGVHLLHILPASQNPERTTVAGECFLTFCHWQSRTCGARLGLCFHGIIDRLVL
jgi:hypothetical protein